MPNPWLPIIILDALLSLDRPTLRISVLVVAPSVIRVRVRVRVVFLLLFLLLLLWWLPPVGLEAGWVDWIVLVNGRGIVCCLRVVPGTGWGLQDGISVGPAGVVVGPGGVGGAGFVGGIGWVVVGWDAGAWWVVGHAVVCFGDVKVGLWMRWELGEM